MQTNLSRRLRRRDTFVITPEIRASQLAACRRDVRQNWPDHALEFPFTYAMALAGAAGMPLEWTRWINRNKHRPKVWLERRWKRAEDAWDALLVRWYQIPADAYEIGSEDELRAFVRSMRPRMDRYGSVTWRRGRFWFSAPADKLVNREIVEPKTNGTYLAGAVGFRFDDYFFTYCVLPYRFREIDRAVVMAICFPDVRDEEWKWNPDEKPDMWGEA